MALLQNSWLSRKFSSRRHQISESSGKEYPLCIAIQKHRELCQKIKDSSPPKRVAEWFPQRRRWKVDDLAAGKLLAVTLMNECPKEWTYNGNVIDNKLFMELVNEAWRNKFVLGAIKTSHIHVLFKGNSEGNWSALGQSAKVIHDVYKSHPTMVLNFSNMNSGEIKATIAHQFGHALGMGHTLMRQDKWEGLKPYLKVEEMMRHHGSDSLEDFEVLWTGKGMNNDEINFDEKSVMRYTASVSWVMKEEKLQKLIQFREQVKHLIGQPSYEDLLTVMEKRPPISIDLLVHIGSRNAGTEFHATEAFSNDWRAIAKTLLVKQETLTLIEGPDFGSDAKRLEHVWKLWLDKSNELLHMNKYPPSWDSFRKLLKDSKRRQTAEEFFHVLNQLYIA